MQSLQVMAVVTDKELLAAAIQSAASVSLCETAAQRPVV
jgi:hypothetical protein